MTSKFMKKIGRFFGLEEEKTEKETIILHPETKPSEPIGTIRKNCANRTRNKNFNMRLTAEEFLEVKEKMTELNLGRAEIYLRAVRQNNVTEIKILSESFFDVHSCGDKLNDVAHAINLFLVRLEQKKHFDTSEEKWLNMSAVLQEIHMQNLCLHRELRRQNNVPENKIARTEQRGREQDFNIRVSAEELVEIKSKLDYTSMERADYLLFFVRGREVIIVDKLGETLDELLRQGVNLSQIIVAANTCSAILKKQHRNVSEAEDTLRQIKNEAEIARNSNDTLYRVLMKVRENMEV